MNLRYSFNLPFLLLIALLSVLFGSELSPARQWQLLQGAEPQVFADFAFYYANLPRLAMALVVGAGLGLVGSLLQQLTQNPLLSPMTLGTSSGVWLALVVLNVWLPGLSGSYAVVAAMLGAGVSMALVLLIVGWRNLSGLPIVLAGMAVNILLGAIATAIILLHEQYANNLFIWGAGDLSQHDWDWFIWLLPRMLPALVIVAVAPRVLALLRLGQQGAQGRGLNLAPMFLLLMLCGLWIVASAITAVGAIGFIGLIAPNIARLLGARSPRSELLHSAIFGALLLLVTDMLARGLSLLTIDTVHTGTATALIGAPLLLLLTRRNLRSEDRLSIELPQGAARLTRLTKTLLPIICLGLLALSLGSGFNAGSWQLQWPSEFSFSLRWPRILAALSAGAALATAGTVLQRLIYNPLASPDILGLSAGATLMLVGSSVLFGVSIYEHGPLLAFVGSMLVLVLLLVLGRRHNYAPSMLILCGIALTALIEALVQFALARGTQSIYEILGWLAGSTYRVQPSDALFLFVLSLVLVTVALLCSKSLTLLSAGRQFAQARGLSVNARFVVLLVLVALLCAIVTAYLGPIAFIGLLAPHMAVLLGARQAGQQIAVAASCGACLLVLADYLGWVLFYPTQVAAGTLVSVIGGLYFITLLIRGQRSN